MMRLRYIGKKPKKFGGQTLKWGDIVDDLKSLERLKVGDDFEEALRLKYTGRDKGRYVNGRLLSTGEIIDDRQEVMDLAGFADFEVYVESKE